MKYLSVIIPAYNEGQRIRNVLLEIKEYLRAQDFDFEVLIIDDGSTDNSQETIKTIIKNWPKFLLFSYSPNQGKGAAVKYGVNKALGQYILFMDADASTPISQFENLQSYLKNYPVVIGSRYLKKGYIKVRQPFWRLILARAANFLIRLVLKLPYKDTQCGFKIFEAETARKIFHKVTLSRFGFDFEILKIAQVNQIPVKEVPVIWKNEKRSKVKLNDFFVTLKELKEVWSNARKGKYQM